MFFAEFIRRLHHYISLGMTQPDFTEEFICHATDRIKKGDYATSSYKRFFAGITQGTGTEKRIIGDTIGPFAVKYLRIKENEYETSLSNLQTYLAELIREADAASNVANAFSTEIPTISSIDINTLAEKISEQFFTIIHQIISAELRSKGGSVQEPKNGLEAIPSAIQASINEKINETLILIDVMLELGKEIVKWQKRHTLSTPFSQCPSWQKLHENYDRYQVLNIELRTLSRKYLIKQIEPAHQLSEQLSISSFWQCYPTRYFRTLDTLRIIEDYKNILFSISFELEKA